MKNYKLVEWSSDLDLREFYQKANQRGHINNGSQSRLVDCFHTEKKFQIWILYDGEKAVGSVGAHSFDDVRGEGSYRVLTRCCVLDGNRPNYGLGTARRLIAQHQNVNDQYFLPKCIEWCQSDNLFATSNENSEGSQKLVHAIYFPTLEKLGIVENTGEVNYRNTTQTVWKINVKAFYDNLRRYERWQ